MRIMYVEDNAVNLELVRRIARLGGHEVISHSNGKDALDALQTDTAHLILMDIQLEGEMDGIEVIKRLRTRGDQRPIIAITAYAMRGDEERILGSGCNDYLPKPLPISQFITLLAKYDPSNKQPQPKPEPEPAVRKPVTSQLVTPVTHPAVAAGAAVVTPVEVAVSTATPPVAPAPSVTSTPTPLTPPAAPAIAVPTVATTPTPASVTPVPVPTSVVTATTEGTPAVPANPAVPSPVTPPVVQVPPVPPTTQPIVPAMEHNDDKPG